MADPGRSHADDYWRCYLIKMLEQKTLKLGDIEYTIQQLPATRGLEVGIHLMKIAMGAAKGFGGMGGDQDILDIDVLPAQIVAGIFEQIDEKGTPEFIKQVIKESVILTGEDGENFSDWYEARFSANFDELYDLMEAIIVHNNYIDMIKKKITGIMLISLPTKGKD